MLFYRIYDFIDLRENLGDRLAFLDACYGENSLAKILTYPGDGRFNLVTAVRTILIVINNNISLVYVLFIFTPFV